MTEVTITLPDTITQEARAAGLNTAQLAHRYALLAQHVIPANIGTHIQDDTDDDALLACALAAEADLIVSGDAHLRELKHYHRIQIVNPTEALQENERIRCTVRITSPLHRTSCAATLAPARL